MNLRLTFVALTLVATGSDTSASEDTQSLEIVPAYLQNQSDFVQQVYSKALIGFAFDRKCSFLDKAKQNDYEKQLNLTTNIFQAYLLSKKYVSTPDNASSYTRDMVFGAIRFASESNCDSTAKGRVTTGLKTAQEFMSLIDSELKKEVH